MAANARSNELRSAGAALKVDVRERRLTIAQALDDPRAGVLTAKALLSAAPYWADRRARHALRVAQVDRDRRVRDLTDRERGALADVAARYGR